VTPPKLRTQRLATLDDAPVGKTSEQVDKEPSTDVTCERDVAWRLAEEHRIRVTQKLASAICGLVDMERKKSRLNSTALMVRKR
jgi:hypothetical protein